MSGGLARGLRGRLIDDLGPVRAEAPPYPLASAALAPITNCRGKPKRIWFRTDVGWPGRAARQDDSRKRAYPQACRQCAGDPCGSRIGALGWRSSQSRLSPTITFGSSMTPKAARPRSSIRRCHSGPRRSRAPRMDDRPGLEHPLASRPHRRQSHHQEGDRRTDFGTCQRGDSGSRCRGRRGRPASASASTSAE